MYILVTGAAGCLGTNLCKHLISSGHHVIGVDNFITGSKPNIPLLSTSSQFTFIELSIESPDFLHKLEEFPIHQIYHLAFPTGVTNLETLAEEMLLAASLGSQNIIQLAQRKSAAILFTSSSEVYGDPLISPQKETYTGNVDPIGLRSPYEEGKRFAEATFIALGKKYGLDTRIARVFNTFGPHFFPGDSRVISQFLPLAIQNEPLLIHGKGSQTRTFLYVSDLIKGLLLIMKNGRPHNVYNIGSDQPIAILDLAKTILKITGSKSELHFSPRPKHDHQGRLPGLDKIHALGWKQEISLEKGLAEVLIAYNQ